MTMTETLEQLFNDEFDRQRLSMHGLPPVHLWTTPLSGDIDIYIDREGRWIHEGGEINRAPMVKLFSSLLRREGNDYYLITPEENWRIRVAAAPFFVISAKRVKRSGVQAISLTTRTGEVVVVGRDNPLWVETPASRTEPMPLVIVRDNIPALISRDTYYELVSWGTINPSNNCLEIDSLGECFNLGSLDE